jgi:hypothetical protein
MKNGSGVVLSLDDPLPEKADGSAKSSYRLGGEKLSYAQLLELLLKADKVITL